MRILFVSDQNPFSITGDSYHGGGWISSLVSRSVTLGTVAIAGLTEETESQKATSSQGVIRYPIPRIRESRCVKLWRYYTRSIRDGAEYNEYLRGVLDDFHPHAVYLFGIESSLAPAVISQSGTVPVLIHLQGILGPYDNAFFPPGVNRSSFTSVFSIKENVLKNGYAYASESMHIRALREEKLFRTARIFLGRTSFDRQVCALYHPGAQYYEMGEILRDCFYQSAGQAIPRVVRQVNIVSTISDSVYKGLDLVIKTARLLHERGKVNYTWNIIGLESSSRLVRYYERCFGVRSQDVGIQYLGVKEAEEVCEILKTMDVYVHPSYIENSPNSICEAQILGLPVVATNVGGVSSLIEDGVTGLMVPSNGVYELASAIMRLNEDVSLRQRLGAAAAEAALHRHDPEMVIERLSIVLKSVVRK